MTNIYKDQDYAAWLDIGFFYKAFTSELSGLVDDKKLKILANSCALVYAMKMRDHEAGLTAKPETKATEAARFAANIKKYIANNSTSENDWMELFVAGHEHNEQQTNKAQSKTVDKDYYTDDEYVRLAALEFMRANSNDIEKQQQMVGQFLSIQQKITTKRSHRTQLKLAQRSWLDRLIGYFIRGERGPDYALGLNRPKKRRFMTIPAVFAWAGEIFGALSLGSFFGKPKAKQQERVVHKPRELELTQSKQIEAEREQVRQRHEHIERELEIVKQQIISKDTKKIIKSDKENTVLSLGLEGIGSEALDLATKTAGSIAVSAIKLSIKMATHAAGALKPEDTPQVNRAAQTTHQQRALETTGGGGGLGR